MLVTLVFLVIAAVLCVGLSQTLPWRFGYPVLLLLTACTAVGVYYGELALAEKRYRNFET